ncbi:MAG: 3-phosphoshikimate 1-carboxyvinyltransferase [Desulfobulbaceae bacterium]|nr:3-phosphoshikimate 1-carboxyvinyltransferase [Desulfobulbaceae bacterium]
MQTITPVHTIDASITVPGSKSLSQRALLAAALGEGESLLRDPLDSEDTQLLSAALRAFGVQVDCTDARCWRVRGLGGRLQRPSAPLYLGNNGTATRLLTSIAGLASGTVHITGDERMAERPIAPLISALQGWGVVIKSDLDNGCPPLTIKGQGIRGGATELRAGQSSQYLSSLLLVAPYAQERAEIRVAGKLYSRPYVDMTLAVMREFGAEVEANSELTHFVIPRGAYQARDYAIEGDASSASYFFAAAAICNGQVRVENLPLPSLQGDARFLELLEHMGCTIRRESHGVSVQGIAELRAVEADMGDMPDVAPTLAVVAAFANGISSIRNIAHLRVKESDRVSAVVAELRRLGVEVREEEDAMHIHGRGGSGLHGARIQTYNDHRIAMSFALAGLRISGVEIEDELCVVKSFPDFWQRFQVLQY